MAYYLSSTECASTLCKILDIDPAGVKEIVLDVNVDEVVTARVVHLDSAAEQTREISLGKICGIGTHLARIFGGPPCYVSFRLTASRESALMLGLDRIVVREEFDGLMAVLNDHQMQREDKCPVCPAP